jgi:diguanylate cyclase (GGDEF)-like protein
MNTHNAESPVPRTILVVDDVPGNVRLLTMLLEARKFAVQAATTGEQALAMAAASPPDMVLLDIGLPDIDGFEVCARLKASARSRDIPVIFLTAMDGIEDKLRAFAVGGVDYVTKPFDAAEVLARVETHLQMRDAQKQLAIQNRELQELSDTDALTGVHNRRGFMAHLRRLAAEAGRDGFRFSLIMFDLDHFKAVNDRHGQIVGDDALQLIAERVRNAVRDVDIVGRWGGEEFMVLCPQTELPEAMLLAERLRHAIDCEAVGSAGPVSASFGVACGSADQGLEACVERVEAAVAGAKQAGRNCVRSA